MAGSYNHAIEKPSGKLLRNEDIIRMLENGGDWYEFAEEAYGMIWYLASKLDFETGGDAKKWIEEARLRYLDGIEQSPGTDGKLPLELDLKPAVHHRYSFIKVWYKKLEYSDRDAAIELFRDSGKTVNTDSPGIRKGHMFWFETPIDGVDVIEGLYLISGTSADGSPDVWVIPEHAFERDYIREGNSE